MSLLTVASVGLGAELAGAQESSVAFRNQQTLWGKMSVAAQPASATTAVDDAPEPSELGNSSKTSGSDAASVTVTGVTSTGKIAPLSAQRLTVTATDDEATKPALPIIHPTNQYTAPPVQPQYSREVVDYAPAAAPNDARQAPVSMGAATQRPLQPAQPSQPARSQSSFFNIVSSPPVKPAQSSQHPAMPMPMPMQTQKSSTAPTPMPVPMPTAFAAQPANPNMGQTMAADPNASYRTMRTPAVSQQAPAQSESQFNFFNVVKRTPSVSSGAPQTGSLTPYDLSGSASPSPRYDRVAYALQDGEAPPVPPSPSDAAANGQAATGAGGQGNSSLSGEETRLGTEPPSNELVFLRRQTVLLAAGQSQFDIGFAYSSLDDDRPLPIIDGGGDVVGVVDARTRQRLLVVPFEVRYGLTDRIQLFANTAVGWANAELATNGLSVTQDVGGISDTTVGMSMLLRAGECDTPDIVFTLGAVAPTGNDTLVTANLVPNSQLGQGFWGVFANLLMIHTWDPMVVFYGVGYNHRFDGEFVGIDVDPGEEFNYQLGAGFAVNSNVSLSASFQGAYITEARVNDDLIEGSTLEPMRTRLAVTVARNGKIWEPFAEIPMTEDAAARVGMTWTY